jgi:NAD(P)-dependent dehydrogenase (short-subunit alcohol dehydrogenase family)
MDLGLTDKVAVVTGAGKGIGLAITQALVAEGARVVAGSRTTENLDGLEGVTAVSVDLATPDGPARLVERALEEHGRLDVLVNNVGAVRIRVDGFLATSDEEFEWAMNINFFTGLRATRAALGPMLDQGSGSIVNVVSVNSFFQPDAATIDYGAAKAAELNLSKSLAQEFGRNGIRVTASHRARSAPSSGWASTVWRRCSRRPPESTPSRSVRPRRRASPPADLRPPRRSPPSSPCLPRIAPVTSPGSTTSSTVA